MRNSVDLPWPFGPMTPMRAPRRNDSEMPFRIVRDQVTSEVDDLIEEAGVTGGQLIRPLEGIALGKRGIFAQPLFDVTTLALDEVARQLLPLLLRRIG